MEHRDIDFTPYVRSPRLELRDAVDLADQLLAAAPHDASPAARRALTAVRAAKEATERAAEPDRTDAASLRRCEQRFAAYWGALFLRLEEGAAAERDGRRASELLRTLFPDGLTFLKLPYRQEWLASGERLARADAARLEADLERVAGARMWELIRDAHAELGEALGLDAAKPAEAHPLHDALLGLSRAIGTYGRVLVGEVDVDDPASLARFRASVAPLDARLAG